MDRVFLDANVLFSAAYRPGAGLLELWRRKSVSLSSSRYAAEEARFNLDTGAQRERLARLVRRVQLFDASARSLPEGVSLPEKDIPILLAAFAAAATHLLTGDVRHFGRYFGARIEGILIQLPSEYLRTR